MTQQKVQRFLCILMTAYIITVLTCTAPVAAFTSVSDDFSGGSNWSLSGDATRSSGRLQLVPDEPGKVGVAWLKQDVRYPFVVEFRAKVIGSGEGMAFLFHHDKSYTPGGGGKLGAAPSSGPAGGWAVELDLKSSGGSDETAPHLGLVGDPYSFHFKADQSVNFNDGKWHTFNIEIQWSTITLKMDGKQLWHFSDYSYKNEKGTGMGFSAASSYSGGSFQVDDFKLQNPGEAEVLYWVTFGVTIAIVLFGTLGGVVLWASFKRRAILKQYAAPGFDYGSVQVSPELQKQIVAYAKQSPDPDVRNMYSGFRKAAWGMYVALFLMIAAIIGTLFMPAFLVLTLGIVLMVVFMSIFGIAGLLTVKRQRPFIVLMGQRMGYIPSGQAVRAPMMQPGPYHAPPQYPPQQAPPPYPPQR